MFPGVDSRISVVTVPNLNQAYNQANTAVAQTAVAFSTANTAQNVAQAAFAKANSGGGVAYANVYVNTAISQYSWATIGAVGNSVLANSTSNTLDLIAGLGINLFVDTGNGAIRIDEGNTGVTTGNANWISIAANGNAVLATIKNAALMLSLQNPANGIFYFMLNAPRTGTLLYANASTDVGNAQCNVQIAGASVTNLSNFFVTSTATQNNTTGANTISLNNSIAVNVWNVLGSPGQLNICLTIQPT